MEGMAAQKALYGQPATMANPVFFNGNARIFRTGGNIAASWWFQWRNKLLIAPYQKEQNFFHRKIPAFLPKERKLFSTTGHFTLSIACLPTSSRAMPGLKSC